MPDKVGKSELDAYCGIIDDIVYVNEDNGYTVCNIATDDGDYITVCGIMPYVNIGSRITVNGKWETNSNYGLQFKVEYYEDVLPCDEESMIQYLSSGNIKGVGKKTAQRIVDRFGSETFDVIENHPEWLTDIKNITPEKATIISDSFKSTAGVRSIMNFCKGRFSSSSVMKIYKKWGNTSLDIIKSNPYRLCELDGITFEHADELALSIGFEKNDGGRIRAGIIGFLSSNTMNGHTFIPEKKVISGTAILLGIAENCIIPIIDELVGDKTLFRPVFKGERILYLKKYFDAEKYVCKALLSIQKCGYAISGDNVQPLIRDLEIRFGIDYGKMQKKAIAAALENGITIITGGPGTGKTTIIRAILSILEIMGMDTVLCAPTGRAAKRLSEATRDEAFTIHRLLEMERTSESSEPIFNRNENNRLEEDVIIVDETSMMDILLTQALLKAIKPGARVIFVGDSDQLPSVGAGNFLNDVIKSDCFPVIALKEIYRQDSRSLIITNSHLINEGEMPKIDNKNVNDFFFLSRNSATSVSETISDLCAVRLPAKYGEHISEDIQVISPSRKGACGTEVLNSALQEALNPPDKNKKEKKHGNVIFREGDKVMQIRNDYSVEWTRNNELGTGIFNGEIGKIADIDKIENRITINFDGKIVEMGFDKLEDIEHAFAITVHKSQGNEYSTVILPLFSTNGFQSSNLFTRNLLYTAVTRAKEMIIIVGSLSVIESMIANNKQNHRYTGLSELIKYYAGGEK